LADDATGQVHWTANAMDAEMRLTRQTAGNGLLTVQGFDALTGRLTSVVTGSGGSVQNLSVSYDKRGHPLSRSDANTNLSEAFTYDALNRLTSSTANLSPTLLAKAYSFDPIGNLLSKSDVGTYTEKIAVPSFERRKPARRPLPEYLPREHIVYPVPATCRATVR
jgi:YD repeat-containing protein